MAGQADIAVADVDVCTQYGTQISWAPHSSMHHGPMHINQRYPVNPCLPPAGPAPCVSLCVLSRGELSSGLAALSMVPLLPGGGVSDLFTNRVFLAGFWAWFTAQTLKVCVDTMIALGTEHCVCGGGV